MNNVELVRSRLESMCARMVASIRYTVSGIEGNLEAVDSLRGVDGDRLVAKLMDTALRHMGHDPAAKNHRGNATDAADANSNNMRSIRKGRARAADDGGAA